MKFVKAISFFVIYPAVMLGIGFLAGVETAHFFYPGDQSFPMKEQTDEKWLIAGEKQTEREGTSRIHEEVKFDDPENGAAGTDKSDGSKVENFREVSSSSETLCADTKYILEETDMLSGTVVETVWKLPNKYIGMNREEFIEAMDVYETFPPLSEMERGFVNLEVLSFSRERVVVQMNYQYVQPSTSFYLAVRDNEVVVYLEDMETVYINTGIKLETLPETVQMQIIQMLWIADEEELYDFLETYSS